MIAGLLLGTLAIAKYFNPRYRMGLLAEMIHHGASLKGKLSKRYRSLGAFKLPLGLRLVIDGVKNRPKNEVGQV